MVQHCVARPRPTETAPLLSSGQPPARLRLPSCVVYSLEGGNPLFFDPDGRGGLLPTVGRAGQQRRPGVGKP